ncbi:MAG: hypothetical protein JNJ58_11100 [Chitinophagaceae bacterium]|nr:hypothetical protein [Chitinophagaceae bacterium]
MTEDLYIHHSVRIHQGKIVLDGVILFESKLSTADLALSAYEHFALRYPKFYKMDLMGKLGILSSSLLMQHESIVEVDDYRKGIILQNSQSSLFADRLYQKTIYELPSPALFVYTLPNIVLGEIAIRNGFKGENTFFIEQMFNPGRLCQCVNPIFDMDIADCLIAGYFDFNHQEQDILLCLVSRSYGPQSFNPDTLRKLYHQQVEAT